MLIASIAAMTVLFIALAAPNGPTLTLIAVSLLFLAESGAYPFLDMLAFGIFADGARAWLTQGKPFDYGRTRKWGSIAFIVGNLVAGAFLTLTSLTAVTLLLAIASAVATAALIYSWPLDRLVRPADRSAAPEGSRGGSRFLPLAIAAAASIQASHALALSFASVHWAATGHSDAFIGAAWAIGVAVETLVFALFGRWIAGPDQAAGMMIVGGLAATARWTVMAFDPGDVTLLIAQASHGLSFAATHAGTMLLIADMAPADRRATAQGWLTAGIAGLTAALTAASGPLLVRFGERSYVVMAAFALLGALLALYVSTLRARERQGAARLESPLSESPGP
jgi:PPP family 3-phenylpropionic acid transporter